MTNLARTLTLFAAIATNAALADPFVGRFVGDGNNEQNVMQVERSADGDYQGVISTVGGQVRWVGSLNGEMVTGKIALPNGVFKFVAKLYGNGSILLKDDAGDSMLFARDDKSLASNRPSNTPSASVVINDRALSDDEVMWLRRIGIQVQAGRYWYDPVCGAWGFKGGPTVGFLAAGIPSAPLQGDASNGTTFVFVNGRRLPIQDLLALQSITGPVIPGRYYMDSNGNAGFEGGPPLINLRQAAASRGGGGGWQSDITGAGGNDDGQGSGFVTLHDSTGRPTTVGY